MIARAAPIFLSAAAAAVLSFRPIYEPDLWWHLAQGRESAAGRLVRSNLFSFTHPEYRQEYTSWLFDLGLYAAWIAAGPAGVQVVQWLLLAATFLLLLAACRTRAPGWSAAAILLLAFFILEPRAIPRPHLASFAGIAACALLVERSAARRSSRPLWLAVPILAIWSNLHVECVFGAALIGMYAFSELVLPRRLDRDQAWRAVAAALVCVAAILTNPYGAGLLFYLYENLSVPRIMSIAELRAPYFPDYRAFFVYVGLAAGLLLWKPRLLQPREAVTALVFGAAGLMYLRLTPLVVLATAPAVAARLSLVAARGVDPRAIVITAAVAALAVSRIPVPLLFSEFAIGSRGIEPPQFFSREGIAFIRESGLRGPVFNSHNLGGYLAWWLYPDVRTFQDSRLQAYPPGHFVNIMQAYRSQDAWNALVEDVQWAVLSVPRPNQLSGAGRFPESEWRTAFRDQAMEIVVRR